jgi:hypothetical protein
MPLPFFTAALASWRAAYTEIPGAFVPEEAADAVVKLSIKTVDEARTADTLGAEREGTGIVIDSKRGLILTIGYLVLEAASILRGPACPRPRSISVTQGRSARSTR